MEAGYGPESHCADFVCCCPEEDCYLVETLAGLIDMTESAELLVSSIVCLLLVSEEELEQLFTKVDLDHS